MSMINEHDIQYGRNAYILNKVIYIQVIWKIAVSAYPWYRIDEDMQTTFRSPVMGTELTLEDMIKVGYLVKSTMNAADRKIARR